MRQKKSGGVNPVSPLLRDVGMADQREAHDFMRSRGIGAPGS